MTTWRRGTSIAFIGTPERYVVTNVRTPDHLGPGILEGTAAWLWTALEEPTTIDQLVASVDAPAATVRRDLTAALAQWERDGLVERVEPNSDR